MNEELKYGGPDEIPQVEATCSNDIFILPLDTAIVNLF